MPGKTYDVGNPKPPTTISPGDRLIDGEKGAAIKCSVHSSGTGFTFSGTIQGRSSESDKVTLTLTNGIVNADKLTGTATAAVNTPQLSGTFVSAAGTCVIGVVSQNVKPGSLWATISCPSVTDASTGTSCSVGTITTFVLENCDGS